MKHLFIVYASIEAADNIEMNPVFNQRGSSLAELMISLAIIMGGISGVLVVFQSSLKGLHQSEAKLQESGILNELHLNLKNKEVCEKNFLAKTLNTTGGLNLAFIQDTLGNRIANVNANDPGSALRITDLRIVTEPTVWAAFQAAKASLPSEGYLLSSTLQVTFQRLRQTTGSAANATNTESKVSMAMPLFIDTNAAVRGCLTPASALEEAALAASCSQLGGVIDLATKTCRFSPNCAAVPSDGKPVEGQCMNQEIIELKKIITQIEKEVTGGQDPATFEDLMAKMKASMRNLEDRNISRFTGDKIQFEQGRVFFSATPTEVNAFGYQIKDPKIASQIFNDLVKDYTDFYTKELLEGTP